MDFRLGNFAIVRIRGAVFPAVLTVTDGEVSGAPPLLRLGQRHVTASAGSNRARTRSARRFYEREGHLRVPRKHLERIVGEDQQERQHKLGAWIGNQRSRAATLTPERMEQPSAIGMRWS
ncbi:helicase associated domain-containing protein [Streptomyces collinus]|uniref:helicase associated domain-containing protein n=1 Tax=Streptomyces collinus TaxID=42684 RepID=UPI003F56090F